MTDKPTTGKNTSGRGQRDLRVRVKTAKGRKLSSTLWLERQLNDPYVIRAKKEGFRGRAAYKIMELDDRYGFLKPGARVVDLGCAPGGWCQVAVSRVNEVSLIWPRMPASSRWSWPIVGAHCGNRALIAASTFRRASSSTLWRWP